MAELVFFRRKCAVALGPNAFASIIILHRLQTSSENTEFRHEMHWIMSVGIHVISPGARYKTIDFPLVSCNFEFLRLKRCETVGIQQFQKRGIEKHGIPLQTENDMKPKYFWGVPFTVQPFTRRLLEKNLQLYKLSNRSIMDKAYR